FSHAHPHLRPLPSFPTRRSSDLLSAVPCDRFRRGHQRPGFCPSAASSRNPFDEPSSRRGFRLAVLLHHLALAFVPPVRRKGPAQDRKSTRLNSSHLVISYAVFCL